MDSSTFIVAFHIGRGGSFNNPGHKLYNPYISRLSDCYEDCFIESEDYEGNSLPDEQWRLVDGNGRVFLEGREQINGDTGILDWDGEYDTDIVKYLNECTDEEIEILYNHYLTHGYMDDELKDYVCTAKGVHRIHGITFKDDCAVIKCQDTDIRFDCGWTDNVTEERVSVWMAAENIEPVSIGRFAYRFENHFSV